MLSAPRRGAATQVFYSLHLMLLLSIFSFGNDFNIHDLAATFAPRDLKALFDTSLSELIPLASNSSRYQTSIS